MINRDSSLQKAPLVNCAFMSSSAVSFHNSETDIEAFPLPFLFYFGTPHVPFKSGMVRHQSDKATHRNRMYDLVGLHCVPTPASVIREWWKEGVEGKEKTFPHVRCMHIVLSDAWIIIVRILVRRDDQQMMFERGFRTWITGFAAFGCAWRETCVWRATNGGFTHGFVSRV